MKDNILVNQTPSLLFYHSSLQVQFFKEKFPCEVQHEKQISMKNKEEFNNIVEQAMERHVNRKILKSQFQQMHQELEAEGRLEMPKASLIKRWGKPLLAIAAILLMAVISYPFLFSDAGNTAAQELYASHMQPLKTTLVEDVEMKGEETKVYDTSWIADFENKNYEKVIKYLMSCLERGDCSPFMGVYLGIAYMEMDELEKAQATFSEAKPKVEKLRKYIVDWYMGMSYLKAGNMTEAKVHFNKIPEDKRPRRSKNKTDIMEELRIENGE